MAQIIEYKEDNVNWVKITSITPINKVTIKYDGLIRNLENETHYIILYVDSNLILKSDEISEYDFKNKIRIKYNND